MKLLAIDTATEMGSVALQLNDDIHFLECLERHTQSQRILPLLDELLHSHGVAVTDLDGLALTHGPGSFTGIRIAVSVIQGIAFATHLPVALVSTLQTMAQGAHRLWQAKHVLSVIDARMQEVYWGEYHLDDAGLMQAQLPDAINKPEAVAFSEDVTHVVGSGAELLKSSATNSKNSNLSVDSQASLQFYPKHLPHAQDIIPLAVAKFAAGETVSQNDIQPLYLRNEVARRSR